MELHGLPDSISLSTWVSICWSPELSLFVAVAQPMGTHRVMTSSNGTSWTTSTASTSVTNSSSWRNVCWSPELSIFVAVAESGDYRVMTSSNGTTWTAQTSFSDSAMSSKPWTDVCWARIIFNSSGTHIRLYCYDFS